MIGNSTFEKLDIEGGEKGDPFRVDKYSIKFAFCFPSEPSKSSITCWNFSQVS